jgi:hypothetical protein
MLVTFPKQLPTESIMYFVALLRGTESPDVPDGLQHAGVIMGCAGAMMDGSPQPVGAVPESFATASDDKLATELEFLCTVRGEGDGAAAIPPWLIPVLLDLVRRWFKF